MSYNGDETRHPEKDKNPESLEIKVRPGAPGRRGSDQYTKELLLCENKQCDIENKPRITSTHHL